MTRRTRQQLELHRLCVDGRLAHAVDLAFEHFADYGPDNSIVAALAAALERCDCPRVRARFEELTELLTLQGDW